MKAIKFVHETSEKHYAILICFGDYEGAEYCASKLEPKYTYDIVEVIE